MDENTLRGIIEDDDQSQSFYYSFDLILRKNSGGYYSFGYHINLEKSASDYNVYTKDGNMTFSDDKDEGDIVLQRDSFYSNLITGFKWNLDETVAIEQIGSQTALRYTTMKFMYSAEINKLKGIISESGQIEKTIDFNEKWTTLYQLIKYARSLMVQNSNTVNQVSLEYDKNPNIKIGDIVEIDEPDFFIQGKFAVKDINYTYVNELDQNWQITLKNSDLISTYIDIFRPAEQEENENTINTVLLSEYTEEQINETHSIEIENKDHTLNFNLEE